MLSGWEGNRRPNHALQSASVAYEKNMSISLTLLNAVCHAALMPFVSKEDGITRG